MKELIEEVAEHVTRHIASRSELVPFYEEGKLQEPILASIKLEGEKLKIGYIDGGSALLLELPNIIVTLNKVAAVVYEGNEFLRAVGPYTFISCLGLERENLETRIFGAEGFMPKRLKHVSTYWQVLQSVPRRVAERRLAKLMLSAVDAVVLDGTFGFQKEENEVEATIELLKAAKGRTLAGLAKSTRLVYKGMPVTSFASMKYGKKEYFAAYIGSMKRLGWETKLYVVRLSSAALKAFLLEVASGNVDDLLYNLAMVSIDPSIPGYPYPLIKVDGLAKVHMRDEGRIAKELLVEALAEKGKELLDESLIHEILNEVNP